MKRLALLMAVGATWLFLAAIPALADGGPHVAVINDGSLGINADSCAGCHRAHTAQGPMLINGADEEALCLTCHGAGGTGSTVDVMTGVQYTIGTGSEVRGTTVLGALRNGGFRLARIDSSNTARRRFGTGLADFYAKVGVLAAGEAVTSAHLTIADDPSTVATDGNGIDMPGIAWGNGANGSGPGPSVSLGCASCHNPHGNGQYRILNPIPHLTGADFSGLNTTITVTDTIASSDRFVTATSHGYVRGDNVTIAGGTGYDGSYIVESVGTVTISSVVYPYFKVYAAGSSGPVLDITADQTGLTGTVARDGGIHVTDAPLPPDGDTRNYTVIQTALVANDTTTGPVLLASEVIAAGYDATDGDYFRRNVPWSPTAVDTDCDPKEYTQPLGCTVVSNDDAPNGTAGGGTVFNVQINAWCSTCHSRYLAEGTVPVIGSPYSTDSGDATFAYRHPTRGNRTCNVCHVGHGSNATMDGVYSSAFPYPDGTEHASSRLLKIDNRGTCQACHDPTETTEGGDYVGPLPTPGVP